MPDLAALLSNVLERELPHLKALTEEIVLRTPKPGVWSPKEELGHLIDSATNNHVRFVRGALGENFGGPTYAQDEWVRLHGYSEMPWPDLVELWYRYNTLLAQLVSRIPPSRLEAPVTIGETVVKLGFMIDDYVLHMRHHVDRILAREAITGYPRKAGLL